MIYGGYVLSANVEEVNGVQDKNPQASHVSQEFDFLSSVSDSNDGGRVSKYSEGLIQY